MDSEGRALYASKKAGRNCVHWHDGHESHPAGDCAACPAAQPTGAPVHDLSPLVAQPEAQGGTTTLSSAAV
jgi:hypothetical protein